MKKCVYLLAAAVFFSTPATAQVEQIQRLPDQVDREDAYGGGTVVEADNGDYVAGYVERGQFTTFPQGTPAVLVVTRSTDGGATWSTRDTLDVGIPDDGVQGVGVPYLRVLSTGRLHLTYWYRNVGFSTVMKNLVSDDHGQSWTSLADGLSSVVTPWGATTNDTLVGLERVDNSPGRDVYVATSSDLGVTWSRGVFVIKEDFSSVCESTLFVASDTEWEVFFTDCVFGYGGTASTSRIKTTDAGATWSSPEPVLSSNSGFGTLPHVVRDADGTTLWLIYANGENISYRKSTDSGSTWSNPTNWTFGDQTTRELSPLCQPGSSGPVCLFGGIRNTTYHQQHFGIPGVSGDPVSIEYGDDVRDRFRLFQNYPNPFVDQTSVAFELTRSEQATLSIYNVIGEEVARLVDAHLNTGEHKVTWESSGHPSGVYYYRLRTESGAATGSMALVR